MLERLKYKNHLGQVIDFGQNGIFVSSSDIHDYSWTVSTKNNKISTFKREVTKRSLPVVIFCPTPAEGVAARNMLMEVAERDVLAEKPGQLIAGGYYYRCYVTGSAKSSYLKSRRRMETTLTITSDAPYWVKETLNSFRSYGTADEFLDYAMAYPYDYTSGFSAKTLVNTGFIASNFRMIVFGPCANPVVYIAGHAYGVNCNVPEGAYLTIDSSEKTITVTLQDGTVTNVFNKRKRDSYIFEPIPLGSSVVSWSADFGVDIVLLEERSEPKWT